jgi:two-component system, response regulator
VNRGRLKARKYHMEGVFGHMDVTSRTRILLAEDDEDYFVIAKHALEKAGFTGTLVKVTSVEELKKYLHGEGHPSLIILDLKTGPRDWREALRCLKEHTNYKSIPIVVLTTSSDPDDIELCGGYCGCSYIQKPETFEDWKVSMEDVIRANLPTRDPGSPRH